MLVLSRRPGESIVIAGRIKVTVLEVRGGQVRLGIEAPRSVEVHREEVYEQVAAENLRAVQRAGTTAAITRLRDAGSPEGGAAVSAE